MNTRLIKWHLGSGRCRHFHRNIRITNWNTCRSRWCSSTFDCAGVGFNSALDCRGMEGLRFVSALVPSFGGVVLTNLGRLRVFQLRQNCEAACEILLLLQYGNIAL